MPFVFREAVRRYLGITDLEDRMATFMTLLQGLAAQTTEASAAQQASFSNLHNAVTRLEQNVRDLQKAVQEAQEGQVSPEVQALAADLSTNLASMKQAADTADNGFEPVEPTPAEPTNPDVPADETPTQPVEDVPADNTATGTTRRGR